jgi:nucleoside-diphosphate-sugar epimerase
MAHLAKAVFNIPKEPIFGDPAREYDLKGEWRANTLKSRQVLGWRSTTGIYDGIRETARWYRENY